MGSVDLPKEARDRLKKKVAKPPVDDTFNSVFDQAINGKQSADTTKPVVTAKTTAVTKPPANDFNSIFDQALKKKEPSGTELPTGSEPTLPSTLPAGPSPTTSTASPVADINTDSRNPASFLTSPFQLAPEKKYDPSPIEYEAKQGLAAQDEKTPGTLRYDLAIQDANRNSRGDVYVITEQEAKTLPNLPGRTLFGQKAVSKEQYIKEQNRLKNEVLEQNKLRKQDADKALEKVRGKVKEEVDYVTKNLGDFTTKSAEGSVIPDVNKINDYAKIKAKQYGLSDEGYYKNLLYNEAKANVAHKIIEPKVVKKFNELYKQTFGETVEEETANEYKQGFAKGAEIVQKAETQTKLVFDEISKSAKADAELLYQKLTTTADTIKKQYEEVAKSAPDQKTAEGLYKEATGQLNKLNDDFLKEQNAINSRYNARYKRQVGEIQRIAEAKIKEEAEKYKFQRSPGLQKKIEETYKEAYTEVLESEEKFKEIMDNYVFSPSTNFFRTLVTGLGGAVKGISSTLDFDTGKVFGDYLENRFQHGSTEMKSFKDFLDLNKVAKSTGQLVGGMLPSVVAAAATTIATQGAGAPAAISMLSGGLAGWGAETADMTGRMYENKFEETGDVAAAERAAKQTFDSQVLLMPAYAFEGLPFLGKSLKLAKSLPKKIVLGGTIELATEFTQEYPQNLFEEAIRKDKPYLEGLKLSSLDRAKSTFLNIAPVFLLGGAGQVAGEVSQAREDDMIRQQAQTFALKNDFKNIAPDQANQYVFDIMQRKGNTFATAYVGSLFSGGLIDQEQAESLTKTLKQSETIISNSEKYGLTPAQQKVYASMAFKKDEAMQKAEAQTDPLLKKIELEKVKDIENNMIKFVTEGKGDYVVMTYPNNEQYVLSVPEAEAAMKNDKVIKAYKDGKILIQPFGKRGFVQEQLDEIDKQKEAELNEQAPERAVQKEKTLFERTAEVAPPGIKFLIGEQETPEGMKALQDQALDAPASLIDQLGNDRGLVTDIISQASAQEIKDARTKYRERFAQGVISEDVNELQWELLDEALAKKKNQGAKDERSVASKDQSELQTLEENKKLDNKMYDERINNLSKEPAATFDVRKENIEKERKESNDYYDSRISQLKSTPSTPSKEVADESVTEEELMNGEQIVSLQDAEARLSNGERIFAQHEMEEAPIEITSVEVLRNYAPDQLISVPRKTDPFTKSSTPQAKEVAKPLGMGDVVTGKGVMEGVLTDKVEVNGEEIPLPEKGYLISGVSLNEGEKKGVGSGQEIYKKALDEHGVLYSHWPVSEDAMRVHDKLVEKGIAKVENITLEDGTELRKITKIQPPAIPSIPPEEQVRKEKVSKIRGLMVTEEPEAAEEVTPAPKEEPKKPEPKPKKEKPAKEKKEVKEVARKIRDENIKKEIDSAWDEFLKGSDILTSGGLDPKRIEAGTKLIGLYLKDGIYKFSDILEDAYAKFGDKLNNIVDELKAVYGAYYNSQATDEEAEKMDASTRSIQLKDIIQKIENDRGTNIVDESQVVPSTTPVAKSDTQQVLPSDESGREADLGIGKSRGSIETERIAREKEDADRSGRGDSEGEHDVALNGNEKLNEDLGGTSEEQPIPEPKEQSPIVTPVQHNGNFIIPPDFTNTKSFNVAQKLQDNIDAIKVLKTLDEENRKPTYEEQKTLFKYVGWGGIKEIGFDPDSDSGWTGSNVSLKPKIKEVLGLIKDLDPQNEKKNISAIKSSVLNAHYTSIPVIRGIWNVIRKGGFKGGNVLEPSAGTGNFIGAMPIDFIEKSKIIGIELDFVTSQILKNLYPNHITKNYGYEEAPIGEGGADLVISNIPFGNYAVHDPKFLKSKDPVLKKATRKIHSYFFARAIQDVKPNGIVAFVTTTGILDSKDNKDLREMMAERTEFLGAIRLPNDSFKGNANTSVTTDIIFLRKFGESEAATQRHDFLDITATSVKHKDRDQTLKVFYNEYFHNNPEMVLGEVRAGSMYGASKDGPTDAMTVIPTGINIEEGISNLAGKIFSKETTKTQTDTVKESAKSFVKNNGERVGNIVEVSNGVYGVVGDVTENPETGKTSLDVNTIRVPKKYQAALKDLIPLREALNELYAAEYGDIGEALIDSKRAALTKAYKTFVKKNGTLLENKPLLELDIDGYNMMALEKVEGKKVTGLADIFTERVFQPKQKIEKAGSVADAIVINLNETGGVDINRVAELLDITPEEAIKKSKGVLFKNPEGGFETKDKYLSGDVRGKLEAAKIAATQDKFYEQNVTALEAVQPQDLNASQIYAPISASWIDTKYLNDFASKLFMQNVSINRLSTGRVNVIGGESNTKVTDEYGTSRMDGFQLLEEAIQNRMPIVKDIIDDGVSKRSIVNETETQKAVEKAEKIKAEFDKWIWADDDRRNNLVNYYNQHFNNVVVRKYDGTHLTFDGYAGELTPKPHQLDGAWMIMQQMGGILDHVVGSGKTLLMVLTAQKMKEMGLIKKPIILGLKANTGDLADRYRKSFPLAKVLSPTEKDFSPDNRRAFFAKMANNDWDAIIMTHDQFGMITQSKEVQTELIQEEIDALEQDIRDAKSNQMSKRDINGLEVRKQNLKVKLLSLTAMAKDKSLKSFEDMAIDFMFVDESQMFKNLSYTTIQRGVAGLGNPLGSNKAFNMLVATRTLQKMYGGDKGTVFASGTPISNTMVEMYLLFKYLRPNKMAEMGINSFDQWANTFARVGSEIEFGVTNSLKPKVRMRDFMNVPEMSAMYREIADVRNDNNLKLEKPEFKKTLRVKTDQNIPAFETVSIGGKKFKVIGRIKGIEKNEYWISLKSIGKDTKVPPSGEMIFGGSTINYSNTEYSDGLLINVVPTVEQRKFAKRIQKFAETKEGSWIGRPGLTDKEQKAYMLLATNLASKMAIDMRLVDPRYPSSEEGKIAIAADTIVEHYNESAHLKGIQLVFSDLGTPKAGNTSENLFNLIESRGIDRETMETIFGGGAYSDKPTYPPIKVLEERIKTLLEYTDSEFQEAIKEANEDNFNVYQELKDKLVKRGIPAEEVVFIHDYKSDKQKKLLFADARAGKVRVIIGSTSKLGTGVNVQERIVAMHHLDVPWRPSDMEQRNGRGIRQGNKIIEEHYNNELPVYMYATESTLDAYKYQLLGTKQQFIDQAKTGDLESREISEGEGDEETGISFSAMTAMLSGNPVILEKAKIDKKAKELETSKKAFEQDKYSLKDKISQFKERVKTLTHRNEGLKKDKQLFEKNSVKNEKTGEWEYEATIAGEKFSENQEKTPAQIAEVEIVKKLSKEFKDPKVGSFYTLRDGEKIRIESTIDEPDGKKWQVRINGKLQFLTTEQLKSNVTGYKREKTVRQRVGEKIVELRNDYIKNNRNKPENIGTINGFDIIIKRSNADPKIIEIGVDSPVSDNIYNPTEHSDPLTIASSLQRQIRDLGDELEANERRITAVEKDIKEKTKYLESLPETFPKQAQLEETLAQRTRLADRLREMTTAAKLPTIEELESLGESVDRRDIYDRYDNALEIGDLYAITEDNVVVKINDITELQDNYKTTNSRYFTYREEQKEEEGGNSLGDTIRQAKIKIGGLQSNIAGIPIALYNLAIETIARAVDAGATLTQAIKKAIADHKLDQQANFDRNEFIKKLEDASGEQYIETEEEPAPDEEPKKEGPKTTKKKIEEHIINSIGANAEDVLLDSVIHRRDVGADIAVEDTAKADKLKLGLTQEDADGFIEDMKDLYGKNYLAKTLTAITSLNKNRVSLDKILAVGIALENEINNIKDGFVENEFNISRSQLNKIYAQIQKINVANARISSKALNTAKTLYNTYENTVAKESILTKEQAAEKEAIMGVVLDDEKLSEAADAHESGVRLTEEAKQEAATKKERPAKKITEKNRVKAKISDILADLKDKLNKLDC